MFVPRPLNVAGQDHGHTNCPPFQFTMRGLIVLLHGPRHCLGPLTLPLRKWKWADKSGLIFPLVMFPSLPSATRNKPPTVELTPPSAAMTRSHWPPDFLSLVERSPAMFSFCFYSVHCPPPLLLGDSHCTSVSPIQSLSPHPTFFSSHCPVFQICCCCCC